MHKALRVIAALCVAVGMFLVGGVQAQAVSSLHWYDSPKVNSISAATVVSKHFSVSRTASGVVWKFACDARWDRGSQYQFQMKSTTCASTRNGASSTVKVDAVRWYYPNGQEIAQYQFGGTVATCDDTSAAQATHTENDIVTTVVSGNILMKVWGLPGCGLASLSATQPV